MSDKKSGCGPLGCFAVIVLVVLGGAAALFFRGPVIQHSGESPTPAAATAEVAPEATPAPTPGVDLDQLATNRQDWPGQVTLLQATRFPVSIGGQVAGSVTLPAGSKVQLVSAGRMVTVGYNGQTLQLPAEQTDLIAAVQEQRVRNTEAQYRAQVAQQQASAAYKAQVQAAEAVCGPAPQQGADGSVPAILEWIKPHVADPSSITDVRWGLAQPSEMNGQRCWAVQISYRTKSRFGQMMSDLRLVYVRDGKVLGDKDLALQQGG